MPMEYDDNDIEDQNRHLTGEVNSKFSPVLRPYALPKFDFSDSLHDPLRFDSLVENEVFLGIPSQEENNWIEDFSRGSGAIEFGSSGAESCSIVRHNNAWSEAASFESVEMLLKSVGQEEMIPVETIIEESEPCDVLDSLNEQMVGCYPSQVGGEVGNANSKAPLESDNVLGNLSGTNGNEGISHVQVTEISLLKNSCGLDQNSVSARHDMDVVEKNVAGKTKCDTATITELQISAKDLLYSEAEERPSAGMEIDGAPINSTSSSQNAVALSHGESHDLKSDPSKDTGDALNQVLLPHKEGDNDNAIRESAFASVNCALANLPHPPSEADSEKVHRTNFVSEELSCPSLDVNRNLQGNGEQLDSKPSLMSTVENSISIGKSTELLAEKQIHGSVEGLINVCGIHKEYLTGNESVSPSTLADNLQLTKGSIVSREDNDDTSRNDKENARSPCEPINVEADQIESYGDEDRVVSAPDEKTLELGNGTFTDSEHEINAMNKAVSNIAFQASNPVHVDLEERASLLHVEPVSIGEMENIDAETLKEPNGLPRESPVSVGKLYTVPELEKTASYGSSGELKQDMTVQHLPMEKACDSVFDSKQLKEQDMVDESFPVAYTSDAANVNEQLIDAKEGSQNSSDKFEVGFILCDPEVKEGTGAVVPVSPGDNQVASAVCTGGDSSCKHDSEMLSVTSSSDLFPKKSSSDLNQNEQGKEGGVRDSRINITLLPEVVKVASVFQKPSGNGAPKVDPSIIGMTSPSECFLKEKSNKNTPSSTVRRASKKSMGSAASPSTPVVNQMVSKLVSDVSCGTSMGAVETLCAPKDPTELKTRRGSGKARGKDGAKKGSIDNEIPSAKQSEKGSKSRISPLIISGSSPPVQFEGLKSFGKVEHGGASLTPVSSSKLPDLNTSMPPSSLFKQPFTDLQQVQLRAQIFVFGSLRQGAVPDEACMASAFGVPDGGGRVLDPVWRANLERLQGARSFEQQIKQSVPQIVLSSTVGRQSSMDTPPVGNYIPPLSPPLWNVSTPSFEGLHLSGVPRSVCPDYHQASLPLNPYQTPPSRGFGPSTSWLSQGPFPGPLVATPPSSAPDGKARLSGRSMTEAAKLTPTKEYSAPVISGLKHGSLTTAHLGSSSISTNISVPELKKDIVASKQMTEEVKSRKRKKALAWEDVGQTTLQTQTHTGTVSSIVSPTQLSTSLAISTPNIASLFPAPSTNPKSVGKRPQQSALISEDSSAKVEDSRQQAENASVFAAAAVNQRQSIWNQLAKQKNSNIVSEAEAKLVSAAVAINAAASVARAAAAAAQVASNAALQAKLMVDEALSSIGTWNSGQMTTASLSDAVNNLVKLDAASILKGGNGANPSSLSIIAAAKEAAQRRIESASTASRHAENLNTILKAAELAADAITQAGKIIAIKDPLPLSQLLEAGPGGHWRVPQPSGEVPPKDYPSASGTHYVNRQSVKEKESNHGELPLISGEVPLESTENKMVTAYGSLAIDISVKEATSNKSCRASNMTEALPPESGNGPILASCTSEDFVVEEASNQLENRIKEGCLVEVCKGVNGQVAWFPARVLNLKDGKAFVHFMERKSEEGREWITIEAEGCMAPKIRTPHPMTVTQLEGARKIRRAAMGDYTYSSGDRVDVWVEYCWREGNVIEKNKKDESTFTVGFPGEVKTMVVTAWNIRPTLVWCDGEWINWSSTRGRNRLSQGDTPQQKGLKRGDSVTDTKKEKDKRLKHIDFVEETQFLPLSSSEQVLNVGKNTEEENKINKLRTGLQTEGSRVIFGVPKPGKKRKFMDVSKHYVAERKHRIVNESSSDSAKYANYTSPQGIGTGGWKSNIKVDRKENHGAESKAKGSKPGKPLNIPSRPLPKKDKVLARQEDNIDRTVGGDSNATDENGSGQQNRLEIGSRGERIGRIVEVNQKDDENVEYGKSDLEVLEPRRSSRKIQPTSRLLEGLQSSLVISKFPSVSHDKSHRSHTSKGNSHG
ncbi:uncharacterized protein LOC124910436 isoform X2 [Impatiens glandulifera]|uniref:uncharacterized protein LOC124910436 isoform X2 n=1 Tax=Impatiens glandulifera TaxID=253017 RepID=UPI001FB0E9AE|nr:uncharacterized protein LOC124910436 isoform X2 [Impatiens glandulifera]